MFPKTTQHHSNYLGNVSKCYGNLELSLGNVCNHYVISCCNMFPNTKQYPELSSGTTLGTLRNVSKHYAIA